ncbi:MAG: type II secretion system protein [Deltaproteobacteria bacterium]
MNAAFFAGRRRGLRDQRGFTLIEIIVVMVILGMAMALVAPAIQSSSRARDVRTAVRLVTGTFRSLQTEAIRSGRSQAVLVSIDDNVLELEGRGRVIELGEVAALRSLQGGEYSPFGVSRIRFHPNGSSSGVSLLIGDREYPAELGYLIHIDPLIGLVSVRDEER